LALVKDCLLAMAAMSRLSLVKLRQFATNNLGLPTDVDLSHVSDEVLEQMTGRKMTHVELTTTTVKRRKVPDGNA
jgi:hypothetical protein